MRDLPRSWISTTVSQVASIRPGKTPPKLEDRLESHSRDDRIIPFYKAGDLNLHPSELRESRLYVAEEELGSLGIHLIPAGAVVFPKAGGAIATDKKRIVKTPGGIDLNCMAVIPESISPEYLFWFFQSFRLSDIADGSVVPQIGKKKLSGLEIPVPPPNERCEIVRILDTQLARIDTVLRSVQGVRAKADQFRRSLLHAAFTGQLTQPEPSRGDALPEGWSSDSIGSVCQVVSGGTPKSGVERFWGGDVNWVTPDDLSKHTGRYISGGRRTLTREGLASCSAKVMPEGSVLFTSRAPIGYLAIATGEVCTNQGFKSLVPGPDLSPVFLYHQMHYLTPAIKHLATGTTFAEVNKKTVSGIAIAIPPTDEQDEIVRILDTQLARLDAAVAAADRVEVECGRLRRSLLQAPFTGDLTRKWRESRG